MNLHQITTYERVHYTYKNNFNYLELLQIFWLLAGVALRRIDLFLFIRQHSQTTRTLPKSNADFFISQKT